MTEPLELVGTREVAEILGVTRSGVSRWLARREEGKGGRHLPKPVAGSRSGPVWPKALIEAVARGEEVADPEPLDLIGLKEASVELKVDRSGITRWRRADAAGHGPGFPAAAATVSSGPVWWRSDVEAFGRARAEAAAEEAAAKAAAEA